jgi:predicted lactoylglutathione lyase
VQLKLGSFAQITRGVKNLEESLLFYEQLGFKVLGKNTQPYPWAQITDGMITIVLGQDGNDYVGLTYFDSNMSERVEKLSEEQIEIHETPYQMEGVYQKMLRDPNDFWLCLIGHDAVQAEREPSSRTGTFGEFSIPVKDLSQTIKFWQKLGFEHNDCVYSEPYPWAIMVDGIMVLGFHQTEEMTEPAITYFAPDSAERIASLKKEGMEFLTEMKNPEGLITNGILRAPDGQLIYLFEGDLGAQ